ncbi:MAG: TonB-dependent receptor, partial [Bacteroidales bacterium]|nr:TonB-dependent receptor [Bacteroidales bacterium]
TLRLQRVLLKFTCGFEGELTTIKYLYVDRLANPKLKWEKTTSWNVGLDLGFFDGRITSTIDYYKMNTTDMIMGQKLPRMTGFDSVTTNLGEVTNDGLEISINTQNIKKKNFQWNSSFSFTWNKNRIKHLYYEYDENGKEINDIDNRWFIGKPINEIWMFKTIGTWQADEWQEAAKYAQQPGDPKVEDVNNDGIYNDDDRQFLGQTTHPIHVQLRNEFVIKKNWTLAFNVYGNFGGKQISNYFMNNFNDGGQVDFGLMTPRSGTYWTIENPTNDFLRIGASVPKGVPALYQVYNASHIRFENLSAAYNIPSKSLKKLGIEKARVFVTVKNLGLVKFCKTWEYGDIETYFSNRKGGRSFAGSDQAGSGYYGGSNRTYTFGVSLTL